LNNIILFILFFFFYSCESDPIQTSIYQGIQFEQHIFKLDGLMDSFQDEPDLINTVASQLFTSGIIKNSLINNTPDTVRAFVSIDLTKFFEYDYDICTSMVDVQVPTISLFSGVNLYEVISSDNFKVKSLSSSVNYIQEDSLYWEGYGDHLLNQFGKCNELSAECDVLEFNISENAENELIISLTKDLLNEDLTSILCENSYINLVIEYIPDANSDVKYIEWYSSDSEEYDLSPKFNLDYIKIVSVDTTEYQFSLEEISNSNQKYYFINDPLNRDWSTVYFANIKDSTSGGIDSLFDFEEVVLDSPIVSGENDSIKVDLGVLKLKLNGNPLAQDSISKIFLAIKDARAYINTADPSGDNYDGNDTLLTDGNGQYDIIYNSIGEVSSREKFNDFGTDNCENKYEDGYEECCDNNEECVYNNVGTQNNGVRNWTDNDGDGLWSEGDSGEQWGDIGSDGCPDEYEIGTSEIPECSDSLNPDYDEELDLHGDNYNPDPVGDDYPNGLEDNGVLNWDDQNNNQIWDEGEGEQWLDYGLDGIPDTYDIFENDGLHQDFEYFFDYGLDNIPSSEEDGYCGTLDCNEGNGGYNIGELREQDDIGEDGCEDQYEIGTPESPECSDSPNPNYLEGMDLHGDNYNIDPNSDNYNTVTEGGTEGNGKLDWEDINDNNGTWDILEGEQWFDYGIDQTEDEYEQYLPENQVVISVSANSYEIDIDNFTEYSEDSIPEFGANQVALWISLIEYNESEDLYELTISIYSERNLDGIKFSLAHPEAGSNLRVSWLEDHERHYIQNVSWHDYEDELGAVVYEKMFEDFSLYKLHNKESYLEILSDSLALINYGYNISCRIDSEEFNTFVNNYSSGIIASLNSKIIIPIDTSLTELSDFDFQVDLDLTSGLAEKTYSSSSIYGSELNMSYPNGIVNKTDTSLEITIGNLIQYHVSKDIPFEGFILRNNSKSNNLNSLYLKDGSAYIYMVVEK